MLTPEPFNPKPKKKKPVRETGRYGTEAAGKARVVAAGGESLKWVSPGHNGVPDQIELYGVDAMAAWLDTHWSQVKAAVEVEVAEDRLHETCVRLLAAAIQFTEYKAPKKTATSNQLRVHARLRARGFTVNVVDEKWKKS